MTLAVGRVVERYRVEAMVGRGGMAAVYRVRHERLGVEKALKVLMSSSRDQENRLVREGRVQAELKHPHIVAVSDVLDVDGAVALLMEYVRGPDLADLLVEHGPSMEDALDIFRAICAGMAVAHHEGMIHRDLKPGNVLLSVDRGVVVPKVADFGLAKAMGERGDGFRKTRTGMTMGTPAYMSPEQITDSGKVDRRTDIWALGCILYELTTHQVPFDGSNLLALFAAVARGRYIDPSVHAENVPERVRAVIEGCLQVDPTKRLDDCGAILRYLDGEVDELTPSGEPLRALPQSTRPPDVRVRLGRDRRITKAVRGLDTRQRADAADQAAETLAVGDTHETVLPTPSGELPTVPPAGASVPPRRVGPWRWVLPLAVGVLVAGMGFGSMVGSFLLAASLDGGDPKVGPPTERLAPTVEAEPARTDEGPGAVAEDEPALEDHVLPEPPPDLAVDPVADDAAASTPATLATPPEPVKRTPRPVKRTSRRPVAAPSPPPEPEPEPDPPAPVEVPSVPRASITYTGADGVHLQPAGGGAPIRSGQAPPGTYDVYATFGSAEPVLAGRITIPSSDAPEPVSLSCVSVMRRCTAR